MADEIKPALTAEQWTAFLLGEWVRATETSFRLVSGDFGVWDDHGNVAEVDSDDRHEAAAMLLYGQPFGFTHDDVRLLLRTAKGLDSMGGWARLQELSTRIAALLPPE